MLSRREKQAPKPAFFLFFFMGEWQQLAPLQKRQSAERKPLPGKACGASCRIFCRSRQGGPFWRLHPRAYFSDSTGTYSR